ncbi:hypothetical protein PC129_g24461 [Phytophthora cactorum]|uniref:Uncharacterized protein n=1 Tax=Phytophthora cactorum TaxID=29920 RepID=A0A8T1GZU6_9STRA|nr:hypothetical protein PC129_g24461 [Phytophthora cactorum]
MQESNLAQESKLGFLGQEKKGVPCYSVRHMIDRLHNEAMEAGIPCAVPFGTACSHCLPGAKRLSERDLTGYTTVRVPAQLRDLRVQLERRDERRDTPSVSGDRSARAGVTPALRSGLRTPSPFPERPRSERSEVPMYLAHDSPDYPPSRAALIAQWWRQGRKDTPRTVNLGLTVTPALYTIV